MLKWGMRFKGFHHPDFSLPVVRRRVTDELIDLTAGFLEILRTQGKCVMWYNCFESDTAFKASVYRLRKAGLVVQRKGLETPTEMRLTAAGEKRVSPLCKGRPSWPRKWNGNWNVLMYDVPEDDRYYRDVLREFLRKLRMGCLQKSVWISPLDIRPYYDDLVRTVSVQFYSFLFEAKTVLGRHRQDIVREAWDMERLSVTQGFFIDVYTENLRRLERGRASTEEVMDLARDELAAYLASMSEDPFLPEPLLPSGYRGKRVWELHRRFQQAIAKRL